MEYTQNRELSWLKFNERVLEEANNLNIPVLERLNFFEIFNSNLDEFFMIRVGSLKDLYLLNDNVIDTKTGDTPKEQLDKIYQRVKELYIKKEEIYKNLVKDLANNNINFIQTKNLNQEEEKQIKKTFKGQIMPFLSPQVIDFNHPFPNLENKKSYIIVTIADKSNKDIFGIVEVNSRLVKMLKLKENNYLFVEKILYDYVNLIFKGFKIKSKNIIRLTRNGDLNVDDNILEEHEDFRKLMKQLLKKRKTLTPVRLECHKKLDDKLKEYLINKLNLTENEIFVSKAPFSLAFLSELRKEANYKKHLYPKFEHIDSKYLKNNDSIIAQVKNHDALLFYPFNSIDPFIKLIKEAAYSKTVTSIKITIYRLASKSKLVDYLCLAAEMGKEVTILIELRARFDELNNIDYSERLEYSGCKVMYGFDEFKVHSKLCLITENVDGKVKYITQIGTGNYNESTVNVYTDYSLITANEEIGQDASMFFQNMLLANLDYSYNHFLVSPYHLRNELISLIDEEIAKGQDGYIFLKLNSITDIKLINKLVEASKAGVTVNMIVRGICCIIPEKKGFTDNIHIHSIVGRFLEHSRIYQFGKGLEAKMYISSADWMTRNTVRRVEVAAPILDNRIKQDILDEITIMWNDNVNGRVLASDGNYYKLKQQEVLVDSHKYFLTAIKEEKVKSKNTLLLEFNKLLKDNNLSYNKKVMYQKEELAYNLLFEYQVNNTYIEVINISKNDKINQHTIAKYLYITKVLENNGDKLCLIIKNSDDLNIINNFFRIGIKAYNKNNINRLIEELMK